MTQPGELNQRVSIATRTLTKVSGEEQVSYLEKGTFWCKVEVSSDSDSAGPPIDTQQRVAKFTFRANAATKSLAFRDRLVWEGDAWEVVQQPDPSDKANVAVPARHSTPSTHD